MKLPKNYFILPFDAQTYEWQNVYNCKTEDLHFMFELTTIMYEVTLENKHYLQSICSLNEIWRRQCE